MPDPYTTPAKLRESFGALDVDAYAPQGTADVNAFWAAQIEAGDRWLDGQFFCIGRAPIPELETDRSPAMITTLALHGATVALYLAVLGSDSLTKGIEIRWELLQGWLRCGAPMGDAEAGPDLVSVVGIDAGDICPATPPKVWNELVPCSGDPRCRVVS